MTTGILPETITEGWRALDLFTDRRAETRVFARHLHDDAALGRVLFATGDAGYGKSLLLMLLAERCCRRLATGAWEALRDADSDVSLAAWLDAHEAVPVPRAFLDFGGPPRGDDRPLEALSALTALRRQLAGQGLVFPVFDFACVWYLYRTGQLSRDRIKDLYPEEELGFLSGLADAITQTPYAALAKGVLGLIGKQVGLTSRLGKAYLLYESRRRLAEDMVQGIQRLRPERELGDHLPGLFAADLNANLDAGSGLDRIVIFLDSHDAFWADGGATSAGAFFERDEWVRRLVNALDLDRGVVVVAAGRERPRWAAAPRHPVSADRLELVGVGPLDPPDADQFLLRAGITDPAARDALAAHAAVEPGRVHPFYLGLCADLVLAADQAGHPVAAIDLAASPDLARREQELLHRFLRYVDPAVAYALAALSCCRAFDRGVYAVLAGALRFAATEPAFAQLIRFSFVWQLDQRGPGWYRVHPLLRRLIGRSGDESAAQAAADAVLEDHYRRAAAGGDAAAAAEAVYHAARRDPDRGAAEWVERFRRDLDTRSYPACCHLLDVVGEMAVPPGVRRGEVLECHGAYLAGVARHDAALATLAEAGAAFEATGGDAGRVASGRVARRVGEVHARLANYPEALAAFDAALTAIGPAGGGGATAEELREIAVAARGRGSALAALSQYAEADGAFAAAAVSAAAAVGAAPRDARAWAVRANALRSLGDADSHRSRHQEAEDHYTAAAAAARTALDLDPGATAAHDHLASILRSHASLLARSGRHTAALDRYDEAVAACVAAIRAAPADAAAHTQEGNAVRSRAGLLARLRRYADAEQGYRDAVAACDAALRLAPAYVPALDVRSNALRGLGDILAVSPQPDVAREYYRAAAAAADQALALTPDSSVAARRLAAARRRLAELDAATGRPPDEVVTAFEAAVAAGEESLRAAPDAVLTLNAHGELLRSFASYLASAGRPAEAARHRSAALAALVRSAVVAPDDARVAELVRDLLAETAPRP